MNVIELKELLAEIADRDLAYGANLQDHPCSVAIKALDQCFEDISLLREVVNGFLPKNSKRVAMLTGLNYNPEW